MECFSFFMTNLLEIDPVVANAMKNEAGRQRQNIVLIASENYSSAAVMEAMGSHLTNKYAEGYPGRRYYGGCEYVDVVEELAIARAKEIFGADHANVQPHSGSQANMAAYFALLNPGDTVLGMSLDQGGHLTHGSPVNFSGRLYNFVSYGVDRETETLNYDEIESLAKEHTPKVIVCGYTAYPRTIDFERFGKIADEVGAVLMADIAHIAGLVAAGIHPSPLPHASVVTSTTHKTLRGPRGAIILANQNFAKAVDKAVFPCIQGGPLMHVIAAKAVAFKEALTEDFREYQKNILSNARCLASSLESAGLRIVSGGTDNHMLLVDLRSLGLTGQEAEDILGRVSITVNKNAIPYDPQPPRVTSGLRLGTPSLTTRGFGLEEMKQVADLIVAALSQAGNKKAEKNVRRKVHELTNQFPVPGLGIF